MQQNLMQNIKEFIAKTMGKLKSLDKSKKYAIGIGIVTIILAIGFSINHSVKNKYGILFSGLDAYDAANVSKELEDKKVETKIQGDTIYVPKQQVDKLRLELSPTITNGSKGFELMDEGSSLSMTDEEFEIKKVRMLQGELEKTIKTFPQVDDARVHITQGEESVFSKDSKKGKAAVYVSLKPGTDLDENQIKSIISLVSSSSSNIPKQSIEVIDQNMTLLSEGIYDENGNTTKGVGLAASRAEEKELGEELKNEVILMLEPIFGKDKVKATVNANLNFDTVEKSEIVVDPNKVIKSEIKNESSSSDKNQTGSPVDNNMTNTAEGDKNDTTSKEEQTEYEVGKTETKTITTSGDVKRITASVAIDGQLSDDDLSNVQNMVESAIGMDTNRGDKLSVVAMKFNEPVDNMFDGKQTEQQILERKMLIIGLIAGGIILLIVIIASILIYRNKKSLNEEVAVTEYEEDPNDYISRIVREKEILEQTKPELSLEDEVKHIASKSPEEVAELIKAWLNE